MSIVKDRAQFVEMQFDESLALKLLAIFNRFVRYYVLKLPTHERQFAEIYTEKG